MFNHISTIPIDYTHGATLFCFGDLQWGMEGFDRDAWEAFVGEFKSTPNAWGLGLGDYGDWLRPSMRARIMQPLAHDDSARAQLDDMVRRDQDKMLNMLSFMEGRLIGLHSGHHEWDFASGGNSTQRLASGLRAPYLGWIASTRIRIVKKRNDKIPENGFVYTVVSTHGNSNARRIGGTANWLEANIVNSFFADQYVMGHGCKSLNFKPSERGVVRRRGPAGIDHQLPRCLVVGGFHKGYTDGWTTSYVEKAGFSPQPREWGAIRFKLSQSKSKAEARGVTAHRGQGKNPVTSLDVENVNRGPAMAAGGGES